MFKNTLIGLLLLLASLGCSQINPVSYPAVDQKYPLDGANATIYFVLNTKEYDAEYEYDPDIPMQAAKWMAVVECGRVNRMVRGDNATQFYGDLEMVFIDLDKIYTIGKVAIVTGPFPGETVQRRVEQLLYKRYADHKVIRRDRSGYDKLYIPEDAFAVDGETWGK